MVTGLLHVHTIHTELYAYSRLMILPGFTSSLGKYNVLLCTSVKQQCFRWWIWLMWLLHFTDDAFCPECSQGSGSFWLSPMYSAKLIRIAENNGLLQVDAKKNNQKNNPACLIPSGHQVYISRVWYLLYWIIILYSYVCLYLSAQLLSWLHLPINYKEWLKGYFSLRLVHGCHF